MSSLEFDGSTLLFFPSDTATKTMITCPAGFLKTLPPNIPIPVSSSFFSRVTNIKTKSANITFSLSSSSPSFLSPRYFYYSFPFPPLVWFSALSNARNLPFNPLPLNWLEISPGYFSKIRIDIYTEFNKRCFGIGHLGIRKSVQWFASLTTK